MRGTIKSSDTITQLFEKGSKYSSAGFLALYLPTSLSPSKTTNNEQENKPNGRLAYIAGKKLGAAPLRSRAKRLLREAARASGAPWEGYDVALIARPRVLTLDFASLVRDLAKLAALLNEGPSASQASKKHEPEEAESCLKTEMSTNTQEQEKSLGTTPVSEEENQKRQGKEKHRVSSIIIGIPRNIALLCIKVYRHAISPLLPPSCRYVPTCSEYAMIAFERFGFWKGLWLSVKRVGRCHPFVEGGFDPVPEKGGTKLAS